LAQITGILLAYRHQKVSEVIHSTAIDPDSIIGTGRLARSTEIMA